MAKYESIVDTVGRTPVVRIRRLAPAHVKLYVKVESFNPLGSVKDRLAVGIIEDAEKRGLLKPGQTVIEATSGNTGIGLAMVCAERGYPLVIVMAENFSVERRKLMRFLGARVVLTPAAAKGTGMLAKAAELAEAHGWFLCRQFENDANAEVHARTTAAEIVADFQGERLDYWVTGAGTGGTLKGVGSVLRARRPETRIVLCEPDNSPVLSSGIPQPRRADGSPSDSHPLARPHVVQGWTPDFVPRITEDALAAHYVDRVVPIDGREAMRLARELARKEGIFVGTSGGATFAGALAVAASAEPGSTLLCMLPDTGERYLSTPLFEDIAADMSGEELEIARSTPGFRFDAAAPVVSPPALPEPTDAELDYVRDVTTDREMPVVLFALEWCEFCWAVRKLFARAKIPYRPVDIDSVALQASDRGNKIRAAVSRLTGSSTIPQIFVGGAFIGGATDLFDAWRTGSLQERLTAIGVPFDPDGVSDPDALLPGWLAERRGAGAACAVPPRA